VLGLHGSGLALLLSEVLLELHDLAQRTLDIALGPHEITLGLHALAFLVLEVILDLKALDLRLLETLLELCLSRGGHVDVAGGGCVGKERARGGFALSCVGE
jgi:hypothetical protein